MPTKKPSVTGPTTLAKAIVSRVAPADPAVDASAQLDLNFLNHDRSEPRQHLTRAGWTPEDQDALLTDYALYWANSTPGQLDRARYDGWEVVTPQVMRGDLILCRMPKATQAAKSHDKRRLAEMRKLGSFSHFDKEAAQVNQQFPGYFSTIEGDESPGAGM